VAVREHKEKCSCIECLPDGVKLNSLEDWPCGTERCPSMKLDEALVALDEKRNCDTCKHTPSPYHGTPGCGEPCIKSGYRLWEPQTAEDEKVDGAREERERIRVAVEKMRQKWDTNQDPNNIWYFMGRVAQCDEILKLLREADHER